MLPRSVVFPLLNGAQVTANRGPTFARSLDVRLQLVANPGAEGQAASDTDVVLQVDAALDIAVLDLGIADAPV